MDRIGKYEILGEIGAGGFGTVYRGRDPILKRMVAIKTCSSEDALLRQRFRREAEIVACLQHPNITTIHDLGEQDGVPYLVQEFLDGEDLSHIIGRRDDISLEQRARLLYGVTSGLAHAHANGIIHRDIKPANIRVLSNGTVKVMDFGIAKIGDVQSELTRTGMMLGTGPYLAPEQLTDEQLDSRCDIFSFGVVAYELFTYQRPFEASTFSALLYKILNQPHTPIREACPGLSEPLVELVERCLIKDRERRISSFEEIRSQLAQVLSISEERKVPLSSSQVILQPTVAFDSGSAAKGPREDPSVENNATLLLSSTEVSAAEMKETERAAAASGSAPSASLPAAAPTNRTLPLIAAAVVVAGVVVAGALWLRGGEQPPEPVDSLPRAVVESAPGAVDTAPSATTGDLPPSATPAVATVDAQGTAPEQPSRQPATATSNEPAAVTASGRSPAPLEPPAARETARPGSGSAQPSPTSSSAASTPSPTSNPPSSSSSPASPSTATSQAAPATVEPAPPPADQPGAQGAAPAPSTTVATSAPGPVATTAAAPPQAAQEQPPQVQVPRGPDPAVEEAGIRAALERYRKAYEGLDIDALAAAWPSLDGEARARIGRGFGGYQALSMTLDGCSIDVTGATALARCDVHQEVTPKGGRRLTSDREVEFRLAKRGETWVIQGV
jgi:serine/threonine-protein kinase